MNLFWVCKKCKKLWTIFFPEPLDKDDGCMNCRVETLLADLKERKVKENE